MAVYYYSTHAPVVLTQREVALVARLVRQHGRATLVVPRFEVRDRCRRALASSEERVSLGVEVTTPDAWIASLWELWGDGHRIVSPTERTLLMAQLVADEVDGGTPEAAGEPSPLVASSGTVAMLARAAQRYLPYVDASQEGAFTPAERAVCALLTRYEERLRALGLAETSSAAVCLAQMLAATPAPSARAVVLRGIAAYPRYLLDVLRAVSAQGEVHLILEDEAAELREQLRGALGGCDGSWDEEVPAAAPSAPVWPQFAEVSGPAAREVAYVHLIEAARERGPVVVAAPKPWEAFRALAPRLAAHGIAARVETRRAFGDLRAGQCLQALLDLQRRMKTEEPSAWWPAPEIPDWIRSPFAGLGTGAPRIARMLDARLRRTRKMGVAELKAELDSLQSRELNRERTLADEQGRPRRPIVVKAVLDALEAEHFARALQLMYEAAQAATPGAFGAGGIAEQRAEVEALAAAVALMDEARAQGVSEAQAMLVLPTLTVRLSVDVRPGGDVAAAPAEAGEAVASDDAVVFRSIDDVAACGRSSSSAESVICLDVDAEAYPLATRDTVATILAEKLGCLGCAAVPVVAQRVTFRHALEDARDAVLAFVARDRQAVDRYPAPVYTELKGRAKRAGELQMVQGLPHEGMVFAGLDRAGGVGVQTRVVRVPGEHVVPDELTHLLLLPERSVGARVMPRALSASQIENYLACPYRWLVSNRAATRRLDVAFGPIEQGNFVHDVMQRFHERLIEAGLDRVTPENLERCLDEMDAAFEELRADHAHGKYTHGRFAREERPRPIRGALIPLDELERNQLDAILPQLREVVRYESDLLPIYTPARFEYSFDKEDVVYAGHPLGGRIDRIDTAPAAGRGERFVVIDYKNRTSVSDLACADPTMTRDEGEALPETWLPGRDVDRAPKVQTLIYAAALERLTGGSAQGAVYFGTRGPHIAGAVDDALVSCEPSAFPRDRVSGYPGVKPSRSRSALHDGSLEFSALLAQVEHAIALELEALEAGDIAPRPAADSCGFCPIIMCPRRR